MFERRQGFETKQEVLTVEDDTRARPSSSRHAVNILADADLMHKDQTTDSFVPGSYDGNFPAT